MLLDHPFFSIIVPTYNQVQYLAEALNSIRAQTDRDWEAVVVNDGSTDGTAELLEQYAHKDARFHIINKVNGGVGSALNEGLRQARGEWICWLSSDDFYEMDKLAINRYWISLNPDCRFFYSYFKVLFESTGEVKKWDLWGGGVPNREWQILELFKRNYINGITICVHRQAWQRVGFFDESLRYGQDYDMCIKLLAEYPAVFIPQYTCTSRHHDLRGSGTFLEACLFDSAKAAIRFVNLHPLPKYFPLLNCNNRGDLLKGIKKTIQAAGNPSYFIYGLGAHPLLIFRVLEQIYELELSSFTISCRMMRNFRVMVQRKAQKLARQYQGSPFGFYWKICAVLARQVTFNPQSHFEYHAVTPQQVAREYYIRTGLKPLKRYLERYESLDLEETEAKINIQEAATTVVVFQVPLNVHLDQSSKSLEDILSVVRQLQFTGCIVLLVGLSDQSVGYVDKILYLGGRDDLGIKQILSWLSPIDVFISLDPNASPGRGPLLSYSGARPWADRSTCLAVDDLQQVDLDMLIKTLPANPDRFPQILYRLGGKLDQFAYEMPNRIKKLAFRVWDGLGLRVHRIARYLQFHTRGGHEIPLAPLSKGGKERGGNG